MKPHTLPAGQPFRLETERLSIRELAREDAPWILALVTDPDWLRFIGDRGVATVEQAAAYLEKGPIASYARHGFSTWRVALREGDVPIGICGLIKRDTLEDVDLGYSLLPSFRGKGYALEAARACLDYGWQVAGLRRIVAITSPGNDRSTRLLERLGFRFERALVLAGSEEPTHLWAASCPQ